MTRGKNKYSSHPRRGWRQRTQSSLLITLLVGYPEILSQICEICNWHISKTRALLQFSCSSITTVKDLPRTRIFPENIVVSFYLFTMIVKPIRKVKI